MSSSNPHWDEPSRLLASAIWHMVNQGLLHPYNIPRRAAVEMQSGTITPNAKRHRLWVVDRILEPQTIAHFLQSTTSGKLTSGNTTTLTLVAIEDVKLMNTPMKDWATAPYDTIDSSVISQMTSCIGTLENTRPLVAISKELIAMKARVWEGLPPISEDRWKKSNLDKPEKFAEACRYISSVVGVFNYLNTEDNRHRLRDTYNAIWDHLDRFDKALHATDLRSSDPGVSLAALWHKYIEDRYNFIVIQAHQWVISHIQRLMEPIVSQLDDGYLENTLEGRKSLQFKLADKMHDLSETTAHAHFNIFLPMHGYKGGALASQDHVTFTPRANAFLLEPVKFSLAPRQRRVDYVARHKYLSRRALYDSFTATGVFPGNRGTALAQNEAHELARKEIRGEEKPSGKERWIIYAEERLAFHDVQWVIIGYRTSMAHSDDEWNQFVAKVDDERKKWGSEIEGIERIKGQCRVEWVDARHLVPTGSQDYAPLKAHFNDLVSQEEQTKPMSAICLVGDSASIESYINPRKDTEGHVLAIAPGYDPLDPSNRSDEEPGYSGWLRILGGLLWDELFPLFLLQSQSLGDFWALAEQDPDHIYRHPLGPVLYHK